MTTIAHVHRGIKLDVARLDFEQARRGITAEELANLAGISPVTLSRAKHGRAVNETTLRQLTTARMGLPLRAGAELIAEPA